MTTDIEAVLFDMDGVLYAYDFENRLNLLESALDVPKDTIRSEIFESGFEDAADNGDLTTAQYISGISARLGVEVTLRQWVSARKWAMSPEPQMIGLARRLSEQVEIALLTNNGVMLAEHIDELAPELPALFGERLFVSGVIGESKERSSSFSALLDKLSWQAETTLFIDDSQTYIDRADEAGLMAHLFDGYENLCNRLGAFDGVSV